MSGFRPTCRCGCVPFDPRTGLCASCEDDEATARDLRRVRELDGLFVGSLDDEDRIAFETAMSLGEARMSYEGVGGFLGLARVRLTETPPPADVARSAPQLSGNVLPRAEQSLPTKGSTP